MGANTNSFIKPFKAIRPMRDKVHLVATRSYITYKHKALESKLKTNPYSFIHIIKPEFFSTLKSVPNSIELFEKVKSKFQSFLDQKILIQEDKPSFYMYRQTSDALKACGFICAVDTMAYGQGKIKKHENIIEKRAQVFQDYLKTTEINAEPVLLMHAHSDKIEKLKAQIAKDRAEYEFCSSNGIKHELWVINAPEMAAKIQVALDAFQEYYIADGHHRCASSYGVSIDSKSQHLPAKNYFMAYLVGENDVLCRDYNRVLTLKKELTPQELREKTADYFSWDTPEEDFKIYFRHTWHSIKLKETIKKTLNPQQIISPYHILHYVFIPLLGNKILSDKIKYIPGDQGIESIALNTDQQKIAMGCKMPILHFTQIKKVADKGYIMPPKSTYILPKLRSALTIYSLKNAL